MRDLHGRDPADGAPLVVISPHLDDAVFSCAGLIAAHPGATVVTVFGGAPADAAACSTDWDRQCGFADAAEATAARRREDGEALALLGARSHVLDFCDSQYNATPGCDAIADALRATLRDLRPALIAYPLGLFHSDHLLAHAACILALNGSSAPSLAYEEALYRALPGLLQQRLAELARQGWQATPAAVPMRVDAGLKRRAVRSYASQLKAFGDGGYADTEAPERCWRLIREEAAQVSPDAG